MHEKTVVISAFEPFGSYKANTGALVATCLHNQSLGGRRIVSTIFPCDIPTPGNNRGETLLKLAREHKAAGILSLGMTSLSPGFWLETRARNLLHQPKYYSNPENTLVDPNRPADDILKFDLAPWQFEAFRGAVQRHQLGIVELSGDVGGFCCEHLAYQVIATQLSLATPCRLPYGFVHFPCCPQAVENSVDFCRNGKALLSVENAIQGIEILLKGAAL